MKKRNGLGSNVNHTASSSVQRAQRVFVQPDRDPASRASEKSGRAADEKHSASQQPSPRELKIRNIADKLIMDFGALEVLLIKFGGGSSVRYTAKGKPKIIFEKSQKDATQWKFVFTGEFSKDATCNFFSDRFELGAEDIDSLAYSALKIEHKSAWQDTDGVGYLRFGLNVAGWSKPAFLGFQPVQDRGHIHIYFAPYDPFYSAVKALADYLHSKHNKWNNMTELADETDKRGEELHDMLTKHAKAMQEADNADMTKGSFHIMSPPDGCKDRTTNADSAGGSTLRRNGQGASQNGPSTRTRGQPSLSDSSVSISSPHLRRADAGFLALSAISCSERNFLRNFLLLSASERNVLL